MSKTAEPAASPKFAVDDRIRVKPGVMCSDYPDICIEGWMGKVVRVSEEWPPYYLIQWSRKTYENIPDDENISWDVSWDGVLQGVILCEDELIADSGEPLSIAPFSAAELPITPPMKPGTKPLSWANQEDRIRAALGLSSDDPLPKVGAETLRRYRDYLRSSVSPFLQADFQNEDVWIWEISDEDEIDEFYGIVCYVCHPSVDSVPLSRLKARRDEPEHQLIDDYLHWFRNWR